MTNINKYWNVNVYANAYMHVGFDFDITSLLFLSLLMFTSESVDKTEARTCFAHLFMKLTCVHNKYVYICRVYYQPYQTNRYFHHLK